MYFINNLQDEIYLPFGSCKLHFNGFVPLHHSNKNLRELLTIYKHYKTYTYTQNMVFSRLTYYFISKHDSQIKVLSFEQN